jgi:ankyrin repeat protein
MRGAQIALHGGKYVGSGSFGCTFSKPLAYHTEEGVESPPDSKLGKVMSRQDAEEEFAIARKLLDIDPDRVYGIYPDMPPVKVATQSAVQSAGGEEELLKCRNKAVRQGILGLPPAASHHSPSGSEGGGDDDGEAYQLIMTRALGDLVKVLLEAGGRGPPSLSILNAHMRALRNLYAGLEHMHANRVCHLDIKPANVVAVGAAVEAPEAYKFIDFGLSASFQDIMTPGVSEVLGYVYPSYPLIANIWWVSVQAAGGEEAQPPAPVYDPDPFHPRRRVVLHKFIEKMRAEYERYDWEPDFMQFSAIYTDNAAMHATYGRHEGAEARLMVARATDVYGLAKVTAYVYEQLTGVRFAEQRTGPEAVTFKTRDGWEELKLLSLVSTALGALLSDMMHMRIRDDAILARFDQVLSLLSEAATTAAAVAGQSAGAAALPTLEERARTFVLAVEAGGELAGLAQPPVASAMHEGVMLAAGDANRVGVLQALLASGAVAVNQVLPNGLTALMTASAQGNVPGILALVAAGADVNATLGGSGWTALMSAAHYGRPGVAAALLNAGAAVNQARRCGKTALSLAASRGHAAVVAELLKLAAAASKAGAAAADIANAVAVASSAALKAASAARAAATAAATAAVTTAAAARAGLVGADVAAAVTAAIAAAVEAASVTAASSTAADAALKAAALHQASATAASGSGGCHVNGVDAEGATALWHAAASGHSVIVSELLAAGAEVHTATATTGITPLMVAAIEGHANVVAELLKASATAAGAVDQALLDRASLDGYAALAHAANHGRASVVKALLEAGANVNRGGPGILTALMCAAANGRASVLPLLLAAGADVHAVNDHGTAAVALAAAYGHTSVLPLLLGAGASVDQPDARGYTALMHAAEHGHERTAAALIAAGANPSQADASGRNALLVAAAAGHSGVLSALLGSGSVAAAAGAGAAGAGELGQPQHQGGVNWVSPSGWTALLVAADGGSLSCVNVLLRAGAQVDQASKHREWTPLIHAAFKGHYHVVDALLRAGADANQAAANNVTALMVAAEKGHTATVSLLISRQANVAASSTLGGWTPLLLAAVNGYSASVAALLAGGAAADQRDQHVGKGWTPLMHAAEQGHADVVFELLSAGASADCAHQGAEEGGSTEHAEPGMSALMIASSRGQDRVVTLLLASGASVEAATSGGMTALMFAARFGRTAVLVKLLAAGASLDARDRSGRTALSFAESHGHLRAAVALAQASTPSSFVGKP